MKDNRALSRRRMARLLHLLLSLLLAALLCSVSATWAADRVRLSSPESVGFSSERLARLDELMQRIVDSKEYAGVVTLLARHGKIIQLKAYGKADLASNTPMQTDSIFRIFSMTKPITGAAMMLLYEDGKWNPQEPIYRYIPEFAHLKVYKDLNGFGAMLLEEPNHPPTMRELMTHTAGFVYGWGEGPVDRQYRDQGNQSIFLSGSLQAMIERLSKAPLDYQPGSRWVYSLSVDIQGYIVEKLSGMTLPEFMKKRLFEPLGMKDTDFYVPEDRQRRFTSLYRMGDQGELVPADPVLGVRYDQEPALPQGGGGLVSTAVDYFRFAQMLLNHGELDGVRILGPKTVELMMSNHLADNVKVDFNGVQMRPGIGYGFDGAVITDPDRAVVPLGKGSYLWDGAAGTWFWIDPVNDIVFVGMVQRLGWSTRTATRELPPDLEELSRATAYQALLRPEL
jgi:CubicO group peptidase (beta-lactamase class C family)